MPSENKIVMIDDDSSSNIINSFKLRDVYPEKEILTYQSPLDFFDEVSVSSYDKIDFLLLDLNMPIMDGWQVLQKLSELEEGQNLRTVVLTSSINSSDREMAESFDFVLGFITKPFTIPKLKEVI